MRVFRSALPQSLRAVAAEESQAARTFFEENFNPVRIARLGESEGLLTGYFEPIVQGSRLPNPEFHVPVYRRPRDLVVAGRKSLTHAFPNKGARITPRARVFARHGAELPVPPDAILILPGLALA